MKKETELAHSSTKPSVNTSEDIFFYKQFVWSYDYETKINK